MSESAADARIDAYATSLLSIAQHEGHLSEVEDELFRFARVVEGNDELRIALSDPGLPFERRAAIADEILKTKALATTTAIVSFIVALGHGRDLPAIVQRFVELAATRREKAVAEVRTAVPLSDEQQQRLAEALSKSTGKRVEVKVIVDEKVLGGVVARIGETVIDGTVRSKLDKFKEQF
jgi:F-type H+-transporting ATPase subunit delta